MGPCTLEGCSEKQYAKGLCKKCYSSKRYYDGRKCTYAGCKENLVAKGYCGTHYVRNHNGLDMDGRDSVFLNKKTRYTSDGLRICSKCRIPQPDSNYSRITRDGLSSNCMRCQALRKYKMTREEFDDLLAAQGGCCAGCGSNSPGGRHEQWHVDHDHGCCVSTTTTCGKCIRGILCNNCNISLGLLKDDAATLLKLAEYLTKHQTQR